MMSQRGTYLILYAQSTAPPHCCSNLVFKKSNQKIAVLKEEKELKQIYDQLMGCSRSQHHIKKDCFKPESCKAALEELKDQIWAP